MSTTNKVAEAVSTHEKCSTGTVGMIRSPIHSGSDNSTPVSRPTIVITRIQKIRDSGPKIKCRCAAMTRYTGRAHCLITGNVPR